jgi:putative exporter of polyketide antibiotics
VVIGSIGVSAIPYSLNLTLHKISALLYFFGVVILQTLIAAQEVRRKLPVVLPVSSMSVVAVYLIFAVLLSLVGKIEGITRNTPVIWEWLAFCSLMVWLIVHSIVLGNIRITRDFSPTTQPIAFSAG